MHQSVGAWSISRDFEGLPPGRSISVDYVNGFSGTRVSDARSVSGSQSARISITEGSNGWGEWGIAINHVKKLKRYDEYWVRFHLFVPEGFSFDSLNDDDDSVWAVKFLRMQTQSRDGKTNFGYIDWYINRPEIPGNPYSAPYRWIYEGQNLWRPFGDPWEDRIQTGEWETYEMYVRFDSKPVSQGGEAIIRMWKNGDLLKEVRDGITLKKSDAHSQRTLIFTWWAEGAPQSQHAYIDDLVLTTERPNVRDAQGNPMIGTRPLVAAPGAPRNISVE